VDIQARWVLLDDDLMEPPAPAYAIAPDVIASRARRPVAFGEAHVMTPD
jgi:hypothetical protein